MTKSNAFRTVVFLRRIKAANKIYDKDSTHSFFDRTSEAFVNRGVARFAEDDLPADVKKAVKKRLETKAHEAAPENKSSTPGTVHIDSMDKDALLRWLDDNVEGHEYDGRFGVKTLKKAVKSELKKQG